MQTVVFAIGSGRSRRIFAKNARRNECFPFLFENDGKMLELDLFLGVFFFFLLLCLAFFSFCCLCSLKKKRIKGKGEISPLCRVWE